MPAKGYKMNFLTVKLTAKQWHNISYLAWEYLQLMGPDVDRKWLKDGSNAVRAMDKKVRVARAKLDTD